MIIIGRDDKLSEAQLQDFEVVRRKYKSIIDIITYDELLRRLNFTIEQLRANAMYPVTAGAVPYGAESIKNSA